MLELATELVPEVRKPTHRIPFWGKGKSVAEMTEVQRRIHGLSTLHSIVLVDTQGGVEDAVAYAKEKGRVAFDLETTGLSAIHDEIVLVQIGDQQRQFLIWYDAVDVSPLTEILEDADIVKLGVNLKFDLGFWLAKLGLDITPTRCVDVSLIEQTITCGLYSSVGHSHRMSSMGQMARHWLNLELPKDEDLRTGWGNYSRIQDLPLAKQYYAADDCCIPIQISEMQRPWIMELGLVDTINLETRYLPWLTDMEIRGMALDTSLWESLTSEAEQRVKELEAELDRIFKLDVTVEIFRDGTVSKTRSMNYASPAQLQDLIRNYMWDNHNVEVVFCNRHYEEALRRTGRLNPRRLEVLFQPRQEPDPDDPKKKKKVGYPEMSDTVEMMWDLYRHFLPDSAFFLGSTDSDTLELMQIIWESDEVDPSYSTTIGFPPELVKPLVEIREASKRVGTYGRNWFSFLDPDGRVRTSYSQCALSTGRLSSSPNFQNPPSQEAYRRSFVASEGNVFVGSDWSQIEPRIIAHLSQDPVYMRVFWSERPGTAGFERWCGYDVTEKLDLYTEVGKEVGLIPKHYGVKDTKGGDATEDGQKGRTEAKITNLALGYGTGQAKFHNQLTIATSSMKFRDNTDALHKRYWASLEPVKEMLDRLSYLADPKKSPRKMYHPHVDGVVTWAETLTGRKRFYDADSPAWWTTGRNMPIQGTAGGDLLKLTACELMEWAQSNNIPGGLVNLIHDELIFETTPEAAPVVSDAMVRIMRECGEQLCPTVPISSEAYIDNHWIK